MDGINIITAMWQTSVEGKRTTFCPTHMSYMGKSDNQISIPVTWQA